MPKFLSIAIMLLSVTCFAQIETCSVLMGEKASIYQGEDGWFFRSAVDLSIDYELEKVEDGISKLSDALRDKGITLVVVPVPSRGMIYGDTLNSEKLSRTGFSTNVSNEVYNNFVSKLQSKDVIVVNLLSPFLEAKQKVDVFLKLDGHWTSEGAEVAANTLVRTIDKLESYVNLPKKLFGTQLLETRPRPEGSIQTILVNKCNVNLPDENVNKYETNDTSMGLLEDITTPVALVGTSYSGEWFNFDGFLRQNLQVDIFNNFVPGGGLFTSLQDLLIKINDLEETPKFIVWEFPIHMIRQGGEDLSNFRQIIPSVHGPCSAEDSLFHNSVSVENSSVDLDLVTGSKGIENLTGGYKYLFLEATDKTLVNFTISIFYASGENENIQIDRSTRAPNSGKYYVELKEGIDVDRINLSLPDSVTGTIEIRECKM